jgi:hypothetical protein
MAAQINVLKVVFILVVFNCFLIVGLIVVWGGPFPWPSMTGGWWSREFRQLPDRPGKLFGKNAWWEVMWPSLTARIRKKVAEVCKDFRRLPEIRAKNFLSGENTWGF